MKDKKDAKIVVIEEDDDVRNVLCRMLSVGEYSVCASFRSFQEGSDFLRDKKVDLILCDGLCGEMIAQPNAAEVAETLRTSNTYALNRNVHFVITDAYLSGGFFPDGKIKYADGYLTKPFSIAALFYCIDKLLARESADSGKTETIAKKVLIADAELGARTVFDSFVRHLYNHSSTVLAETPDSALEYLSAGKFDLVLCGWSDVARKMRTAPEYAVNRETPFIFQLGEQFAEQRFADGFYRTSAPLATLEEMLARFLGAPERQYLG
jgi:CheY-like chemotaxis protein